MYQCWLNYCKYLLMITLHHINWIKYFGQITHFFVLLGFTTMLFATTREDAIKAGIVYNLTKFTTWPESNINHSQFNLCIFGNQEPDAFDALFGKLVMDKPLVINRNPKDADIHACQVVYIKNTSQKKIHKILNKCKTLPILTMSESSNFIDHGGMIGLVTHENHIGFEANIKTIDAVGIHISAQLLKLAKRIVRLNEAI